MSFAHQPYRRCIVGYYLLEIAENKTQRAKHGRPWLEVQRIV